MSAAFALGRPRRSAVVLALALAACGCGGQSLESRARAAGEEVARSIAGSDDAALAQNADAELVREVQRNLHALDEYLGPIDGRLDTVTVNAIEAFQRAQRLPDDGMLDDRTLARLRSAAPGS